MKKYMYFQYLVVFFVLIFMAFPAKAAESQVEQEPFFWGPMGSKTVETHLYHVQLPQDSRWAGDDWAPQDWVDSRGGSVLRVVDGLYEHGVITDQYYDDQIPVLEVGQSFVELSQTDRRRVVMFMDEAFGVTRQSRANVMLVRFHKKCLPMGVLTAQGYQVQ